MGRQNVNTTSHYPVRIPDPSAKCCWPWSDAVAVRLYFKQNGCKLQCSTLCVNHQKLGSSVNQSILLHEMPAEISFWKSYLSYQIAWLWAWINLIAWLSFTHGRPPLCCWAMIKFHSEAVASSGQLHMADRWRMKVSPCKMTSPSSYLA